MSELLLLGGLVLLVALGGRGGRRGLPADGKPRDGGREWGDGDFDGFDFAANGLRFDGCNAVAEGRHFFPHDWADVDTWAIEAPTLAATLAVQPDNTVMGFIDYLTESEGIDDPAVVAARILEEASPECAAIPQSKWGPAMRAWYASLSRRVTAYVTQETIG